jgi:hypothetical protein
VRNDSVIALQGGLNIVSGVGSGAILVIKRVDASRAKVNRLQLRVERLPYCGSISGKRGKGGAA